MVGFPRLARADHSVTVIIQLAPGADANQLSLDHQATILDSIEVLSQYRLQGTDHLLLDKLRADPRVIAAKEDSQLETFETQQQYLDADGSQQGKPPYVEQWAIKKVRAPQAQRLTTGQGVTVAVVDTGVALDHPELADRLLAGYDFVNDDADPNDVADGLDNDGDDAVDEGAGHGTHVAGIVALVAPDVSLMPVRVLDSEGVGDYFDVVAGIVYAVDHGAQVINLSFSGDDDADFLQAAIDYAWQQGAVVVAAARAYDVAYPAQYEHVISVGATDKTDQVAEFSDYRPGRVTVFAPGVSIYSTYYDGGYAWWTGTSMAAPFVSGEAALLLSTGGCDNACAAALIPAAVRPVVPNLEPRGRIDLYDAVKTVIE